MEGGQESSEPNGEPVAREREIQKYIISSVPPTSTSATGLFIIV